MSTEPSVNVEREVKLEPSPDFDLGRLSSQLDEYLVSRPTQAQLHTVYYDTPDLRLARAGFNLRYRWDEGWMLKVPFKAEEVGAQRAELRFSGEPEVVPPAALALVRAFVRTQPVGVVAELRTIRRQARIATADVAPLADVVDDDVSVVRAGQVIDHFRQAEVEALEGADGDAFDQFVARLQTIGAGEVSWQPKLERALGIEPAGTNSHIDPALPAGALIGMAVGRRVDELLRNDFLIRFRGDPEDVHHARSATRKLRATLRAFRWSLDCQTVEELRDEVRWLADELGAVRDVDVALAALHARAEQLPSADTPYVGEALEPLLRARETARHQLDQRLGDERYLGLLDRLEAFAASARPRPSCAGLRAGDLARTTMRKTSRKLRDAIRQARAGKEARDLHKARIAVRNGRYAAEACEIVVGKAAKRMAKRLSRLQDSLGAIHDAAFVQDRLRAATAEEPRAPLVAGELLAYEALEGEKARRTWRDVRKKALRKNWATSRG